MAKFYKKKLAEACEGLQDAVVKRLCNENLPKNPEDWARLFETQAEKAIEENNKLLPAAFARLLKEETEALAKMFPNNKQNTEFMKTTTAQDIQKELCERFYIESTHFSNESECSHKCPMFSEDRNGDKYACARTLDNFCKVQELYELYQKQAEPYESCELFKNFNMSIQNTEIMKEKTTVFVVSSKFCGDFYIDAAFSTRQKAEDFITEREMSSASITELTIDKPSEYTEDIPFRPTPRHDEERVNHPEHYQHPSGIECITVARHHDFNIGNALKYIWRAGLKQEQGISPTDKQIEDLQKAAFYIQDEIQFLKSKQQEQ